MLDYLKNFMPNRLAVIFVASLFILLSNSSIAQSTSESTDSESTDSELPDFVIEPAWDESVPWSNRLGSNDGENNISFNVTNIGGDVPEDCFENCSIRYWIDNGTDNERVLSYHFGSHINTSDSGNENILVSSLENYPKNSKSLLNLIAVSEDKIINFKKDFNLLN